MPITDYSTTPGSNTAISGINIAEGCPPASLNDAIRQLMADMAGWRTGSVGTLFTAGGTFAGAYTFSGAVTFSSAITFSTALGVSSGGTGAATFTANQLLKGNGTSALTGSIISDNGTVATVAGALRVNSDILGQAGNAGAVGIYGGSVFTAGAGVVLYGASHSSLPNVITFTNGSYTERMRIDASGNVGIGTAAPTNKLSVSGGAHTISVAITAAATTTIDCTASNVFRISMGANITTLTVSNPSDGQTINVRFVQDATGSRTVTWPASFKWSGTAPVLSTAANARDFLVATYDATSAVWDASLTKGFA